MSDPNAFNVGQLAFRSIVTGGKVELAISTDLSHLRTLDGSTVMLPSATLVSGNMTEDDLYGLREWLHGVTRMAYLSGVEHQRLRKLAGVGDVG